MARRSIKNDGMVSRDGMDDGGHADGTGQAHLHMVKDKQVGGESMEGTMMQEWLMAGRTI